MTAAEMVNRLRWLGYLIIEPGMGDVPRVDVGQVWVSPRRNVEDREVLQIGSYPAHPATGDRIITFSTPTRGHDGSPCLLEEGKFILWARRMAARPKGLEGPVQHLADSVSNAYARGLCDAAAMLDVDRQTLRLHAGELSPQEMLAVLAVLGWKRREMLGRAEGLDGIVENEQRN